MNEMKMQFARADAGDLAMAQDLCRAFDALTQRWGAHVPDDVAQPEAGREVEPLDLENPEQCQRVLKHLVELAERASLYRVVGGCIVMLDPRNEVVDPKSDVIAHHPKRVANAKALEELAGYIRSSNGVAIDRATIKAEDFWRITGLQP